MTRTFVFVSRPLVQILIGSLFALGITAWTLASPKSAPVEPVAVFDLAPMLPSELQSQGTLSVHDVTAKGGSAYFLCTVARRGGWAVIQTSDQGELENILVPEAGRNYTGFFVRDSGEIVLRAQVSVTFDSLKDEIIRISPSGDVLGRRPLEGANWAVALHQDRLVCVTREGLVTDNGRPETYQPIGAVRANIGPHPPPPSIGVSSLGGDHVVVADYTTAELQTVNLTSGEVKRLEVDTPELQRIRAHSEIRKAQRRAQDPESGRGIPLLVKELTVSEDGGSIYLIVGGYRVEFGVPVIHLDPSGNLIETLRLAAPKRDDEGEDTPQNRMFLSHLAETGCTLIATNARGKVALYRPGSH